MSEAAYPWNVLGIEETDDKKVIKKAYASLIKQFKPDEHPEKFQEIQEAYQYALYIIRSNIHNEKDHYDSNENPLKQENKGESNEIIINPKTEYSDEQIIANKIRSSLEDLLNQSQKSIDTVSNWSVFKDFRKIDDIELKNHVSLNVFKYIAEFNLDNLSNSKLPYINIYNIHFLDKIFNWSDNWRDIELTFPHEYIQVTLLRQEKTAALDVSSTPYFSRIFAVYLDCLMAALILYLLNFASRKLFSIQYEEDDKYTYLFSICLVYRITMESIFPSRRSLGKVAREIYLIDKFGVFCTLKTSLIRHIMITSYFLPIIINQLFHPIDELYLIVYTSIIVLANISTLAIKGVFIHDLVSKSYVIQGEN